MTPPESSRLVRWLLRLYPRRYRERYRAEIEAFIAEELRATDGGFRFRLRLVADHLAAAYRVRTRTHAGRGDGMRQDFRWALRSLVRARGFTLFAVLTLGLGVGATASVFTVLDRVVLRPFPWEGSDRLVQIGTYILNGEELERLSQPLLRDYIERLDGVEAIVGANGGRAVLTGAGDAAEVSTVEVSAGYFDFFKGRPEVGRLLVAADHAAGGAPTAVLSHAFWTERFGGDAGIVGRTIELDGVRHAVVGVLAAGFTAPQPAFWGDRDVIVAMGLYRKELEDGAFGVRAAARLAPGTTIDQLSTQLTRIGRTRYEDVDGFVTGFGTRPLGEMIVGEEIRRSLGRVLGAVTLLLLIGCVNVASLLLTRGAQRLDELRVRAAVGATRGRLISQLVAESSLLAVAGGLVGGGIAWAGVEFFRNSAPSGIPRIAEVSVDLQSFLTTMGLSLLTVSLFGLLPALAASRSGRLGPATRSHGASRRDRAVRNGLVLTETALAVVLVVWSGLLSRDLVAMATDDPGFRTEGLVAARISLQGRPDGETEESRRAFLRQLSESAGAIHGVGRVAFATELPYTGNNLVNIMTPEGHEDDPDGFWMPTVSVEGAYFEALGIEFVDGRPFDTASEDDLAYAVVNEAFVRRFWPDGRAVGRLVKSGAPDVDEGSFEVVGVIADVRAVPGEEPPPKVYVDYSQEPFSRVDVLLQFEGPTEETVRALRSAVADLDPGLPLARVVTLSAVRDQALAAPTFFALLFSSFGVAALVLALVGVYGTTAYATATRTREIGIRVALGEQRASVLSAILWRTATVVGSGVALGSAAALAAGRIGADTLRLVRATDPLTYAGVAFLVLASGLIAAWLPARRLTRIDPSRALRAEGT